MKKAAAILCCLALLWMQATVLFGGVVHESSNGCHCSCDAAPANPAPASGPLAAERTPEVSLKQIKKQEVRKAESLLEMQISATGKCTASPTSTQFVPPSPPPIYERHCSYLI